MNNKEKILKTLKDFGRMPSSRIRAIVGINYDVFKKLSEELLKENKIIKQQETTATYWELNRGQEQ